jgi:transcriptional regulator with XRE-family HTH domain
MTGQDLKGRRQASGWSQEALARLLDVSLSTVARWEQMRDDEIPNSTMLELALEALEARAAVEKKRRRSK